MRRAAWIAMGMLAYCTATLSTAQECYTTATGDIDKVDFHSKVFNNTRTLRVLLPAGYRTAGDTRHRYSVLYLNDGQNLYDACTSFNHQEWRVDKTVARLMAAGDIPPIIVVGIDNAGRRERAHEYLPYSDDTLTPADPDPQGRLYPQFLLDEVVPFVEQRYRTRPGPANRVLGGSSYGAGAALYALIARPASFFGLLLESPSVYASDYRLLQDAARVTEWPKRVFIGTGTVREPVDDVRKLEAIFRNAGLDDRRLRVVIQEGGEHNETSWARRLPEALKFLFAIR